MGLAFVKLVTTNYGGTLFVDLEADTGTAWQILVPRIRDAA
jgi:signal transduction histidine kinase